MTKRWTDKERRYLKTNYNSLPMTDLVLELGRSSSSIRSQVDYLRKRGWTFNRVRDNNVPSTLQDQAWKRAKENKKPRVATPYEWLEFEKQETDAEY